MIRHFLNPPNWFTSASLFCSTYALSLLLVADHPIDPALMVRACILVIFSGVFDLLDGRVARLTNRYTEFGVQLDTIADVVGFGVAPALLAYTWKLHELGAVGAAASFAYVVCAAFRLARFNVTTQAGTWDFKGHSQGLTSTMAGGSLVSLIWVANGVFSGVLDPPAWAIAFGVASLGLMMVSSIPFRNFKDLRQNKVARRLLALCLACCLVAALAVDASMWWAMGAALYLTVGLVDGVVVAIHHRRLKNALLIDEIEEALDEGLGGEEIVPE
ncbi:MAG: CDP-alcohol phosphatidyltransferase family protein [Deltaproteobacteria bacterium]|nr:CDP-alcohol phosphatidyltransferase family protein [Deltaproteobacteria bacterium]